MAVVLYVLETYLVSHMQSDRFFKCRSLNQQDKTIQTNTSGRSTMYHCSSKFFNTLETTKEICKCLLKEKMFNMERMAKTGKRCRAAQHIRTSLCALCLLTTAQHSWLDVSPTVWSQNESPTGNDVVKQVFSKKNDTQGNRLI